MLSKPGEARKASAAPRSRRRVVQEDLEDVVRRLQRLPPNKSCADCSSKLTQCVNLNHGTFVCMACSGVHREFNHKIKGIGHSSFTADEVAKLRHPDAGNEAVNAIYLAKYDPRRERLKPPHDNNDLQLLRAWIQRKYIDKSWMDPAKGDVQMSSPSPKPSAPKSMTSPTRPASSKSQASKRNSAPKAAPPPAPPQEDLFGFDSFPPASAPASGSGWDAFGGSSTSNNQPPTQPPSQPTAFQADFSGMSCAPAPAPAPPAPPAPAFQADFGNFSQPTMVSLPPAGQTPNTQMQPQQQQPQQQQTFQANFDQGPMPGQMQPQQQQQQPFQANFNQTSSANQTPQQHNQQPFQANFDQGMQGNFSNFGSMQQQQQQQGQMPSQQQQPPPPPPAPQQNQMQNQQSGFAAFGSIQNSQGQAPQQPPPNQNFGQGQMQQQQQQQQQQHGQMPPQQQQPPPPPPAPQQNQMQNQQSGFTAFDSIQPSHGQVTEQQPTKNFRQGQMQQQQQPKPQGQIPPQQQPPPSPAPQQNQIQSQQSGFAAFDSIQTAQGQTPQQQFNQNIGQGQMPQTQGSGGMGHPGMGNVGQHQQQVQSGFANFGSADQATQNSAQGFGTMGQQDSFGSNGDNQAANGMNQIPGGVQPPAALSKPEIQPTQKSDNQQSNQMGALNPNAFRTVDDKNDAFDAFDSLSLEPSPGFRGSAAASDVSAASSNAKAPSAAQFKEGQQVIYTNSTGSCPAQVTKVHYDDELHPYYTISLNGREKQTEESRLSAFTGQQQHGTMDSSTVSVTSVQAAVDDTKPTKMQETVSMLQNLNANQLVLVQQFISTMIAGQPQGMQGAGMVQQGSNSDAAMGVGNQTMSQQGLLGMNNQLSRAGQNGGSYSGAGMQGMGMMQQGNVNSMGAGNQSMPQQNGMSIQQQQGQMNMGMSGNAYQNGGLNNQQMHPQMQQHQMNGMQQQPMGIGMNMGMGSSAMGTSSTHSEPMGGTPAMGTPMGGAASAAPAPMAPPPALPPVEKEGNPFDVY